ncbi:MAG: DUF2442 domain-containing protein [Ruminococcus sp.]|nr:DUF2442 domain-containing protein [Ruminococcus sp.]
MKTVTKVQPLDGYRLLVEFENGQQRISDLSHLLEKPVFSFLKNRTYFSAVYVAYGTITWKDADGNEVDICPDKLYMDSVPI